jgi:DNA-binding transcriptional LysR family regulator
MELRILRHVVVLARQLSYTKAAEELGLSQSALSRSIQSIEQRANVRLFDRDRGGVHLTTVGRIFADRASALLREADDLNSLLDRASEGDQGEIAYGMAPLPAAALLPSVLANTLRDTPELHSQIAVRNAAGLMALLISEKIEFFVCAEGQVPEGAPVRSAALGWFPIDYLVRAGHPLLAEESGAARKDFPLIVAASLEQNRNDEFDGYAYRSGSQKIIVEDYGTLVQLTATSDAIWFSSAFAVADELRRGRLKILPFPPGEDPVSVRMMIYSLDRRSLSPAGARLKEQFGAQIQALRRLCADHALPGGAEDSRRSAS